MSAVNAPRTRTQPPPPPKPEVAVAGTSAKAGPLICSLPAVTATCQSVIVFRRAAPLHRCEEYKDVFVVAYFERGLNFFGFPSSQHLNVTRHLFAGPRLSRSQFDVPSYQLIATCK